jgi:membrane-associated phospholipid phosphatase
VIDLIKKNKLFYILTAVFWAVCVVVLLSMYKGRPLVLINSLHQPVLDYFFFIATYIGDGLFSVCFLLCIFLFVNMRKSIVITIVFLLVVAVVQYFKNVLFDGEPRPFVYLQGTEGLYYIPWLEIHRFNSFPSGHTAQAFCFALCLCFYDVKKKYTTWLFILALLTGLSRMYLMQHFLADVFAGSLIAVSLTTLVFPLLEYRKSILQRPGLDQSLISFLKKDKS